MKTVTAEGRREHSIEEFSKIAGSRIFEVPGAYAAFDAALNEVIEGHSETPGCCPPDSGG